MGKIFGGVGIALLVLMLVGFFVALPLGLLGVGAYRAVKQDRWIRAATPVDVAVVRSRVIVSINRKSTSYRPSVEYGYVAHSQPYSGASVTPLDDDRSKDWADDVVRRYPDGSQRSGFYVAGDPSRSFLVKRYSGEPYAMYYIGLGLVAFFMTCGAGFIFTKSAKALPATDVKDGKWTRLGPSRTLRARMIVNVAQGLIVLGLTAYAAWHYHARAGGRDPRGIIAAAAFVLWGLLFFYFAWRAWMTARAVSDARVLIEADSLRPGRTARVRVQQEMAARATIEELKIGLVCTKTEGQGKQAKTSKQWEHWHVEANPRPAAPKGASASQLASRLGLGGPDSRQTLTAEAPIAIPSEQPPSRPAGSNPSFAWKLLVRTAIANCPDYEQEFDVTVLAAEG